MLKRINLHLEIEVLSMLGLLELINIDQLNKENYIVKSINLLGQKDVNKGFRIDIFNNGSIKKQYLFK